MKCVALVYTAEAVSDHLVQIEDYIVKQLTGETSGHIYSMRVAVLRLVY